MTDSEPANSERKQANVEDWLLACFQKALGHELPNHLVATQGLLRLLEMEEGERLSNDGRDYLRRLSAGAERSQALIRALAEIIQAARSTEPAQVVPLPEVVREVAAEMKQLFPTRAIDFLYDILIPVLVVPPRSFRQALVHLLRQAIQSALDPNPRVEVGASPTPAGVELRVTDNGPVLSAEQQHHLFEPFAGGEEGSAQRLSLVLVRTLVDNWGGSVQVQSEPGRGLRSFVLHVPRR
jgi:signal transduction histidine kinase